MAIQTETLLDSVRKGFQSLEVADTHKQAALAQLKDWLAADKFQGLWDPQRGDYRRLLERLIEDGQFDLLLDSFYQVIPFGTGGRRGPVGIGPNRINPYTIASSVQGHVEYLRQILSGVEELSVVVAYDVRRYADLRQSYPPSVQNPLRGMTSKDLAHIAAAVYCASGVRVYMIPDEWEDYISTPELSFFIRHFGAQGGLNISASHNHPDDNGGKFYNLHGGQEVPPYDEQMVKIVEGITEVKSIPYEEARRSNLLVSIEEAGRTKYLGMNMRLRLREAAGGAKIVFSPLHGTGANTVGKCLTAMGFLEGKEYFVVEEQKEFRGDFANVKFRSPNPEVPESLDLAIAKAEQAGADLVLATDPDADRLGGAAPRQGRMQFLNGNEFAVLATRYRLEALKRAGKLPRKPLVIKTQVTTELMAKIAEAFGGHVIGDLLVGFKYIGNILAEIEEKGRYRDFEGSLADFVIGAEESHGLLLTPEVRDKDAAGAAIVLAELAAELNERGSSIYAYLTDTYKRYGYHRNFLRSTIMQGATGLDAIKRIQDQLRKQPPGEIAGRNVLSVIDYWDEKAFGPVVSETDRSSRNLLTFEFEGGLKATIRPSGTEPKNKIYIEQGSEPLGPEASGGEFDELRRKVDEEVYNFSNEFLKKMLEIVGVRLTDYALQVSDLVALPQKQHFCGTFIPELEARAQEALAAGGRKGELGEWIDGQLSSYGPDGRLLVRRALEAYLAEARRQRSTPEEVLKLAEEVFFDGL